jgi:hypothetical protein
MRHEKIVLVILGYIIGFTTAYIGFYLQAKNVDYIDLDPVSFQEGINPYVAGAVPNQARASELPTLLQDDTGFYFVTDGNKIVISGALYDGVTPGPGFHADIPVSKLSPSDDFVYYCEQETEAANTCNQYVYEVSSHTIYPLKYEGVTRTASLSDDSFSWTTKDTLTNGELSSVSTQKPWTLTSSN